MMRLKGPKDENNNTFKKMKYEEQHDDTTTERNNDEEFYDMRSDGEKSTNGENQDNKGENYGAVETKEMESEEKLRETADSKPTQSYIALIAMAILSSPNSKMVLSEIYQYILDNYPFYKTKDKSWRNSIRHNLSLNECFVKAGRSENGKGNYWAIHPSNIEDFAKGDYRRRRARRKTKRQSHSFGLYSECFQSHALLSPMLGVSRKFMPCLWGGYERRNFMDLKVERESLPQQRSQKSFTIENILGLEKEKKDSLSTSDNHAYQSSRRHHSTPSYHQQQSPVYTDGSAFSPFHRTNSTIGNYPTQGIPLEYCRPFHYLPYGLFNTRNSVQELSKTRQSLF